MTCTGPYFLFFCRGFKLVGPMVIMVYRMLAQDIVRWGKCTSQANIFIRKLLPVIILSNTFQLLDPDLDLSSSFS